jgi:hypothetical protein
MAFSLPSRVAEWWAELATRSLVWREDVPPLPRVPALPSIAASARRRAVVEEGVAAVRSALSTPRAQSLLLAIEARGKELGVDPLAGGVHCEWCQNVGELFAFYDEPRARIVVCADRLHPSTGTTGEGWRATMIHELVHAFDSLRRDGPRDRDRAVEPAPLRMKYRGDAAFIACTELRAAALSLGDRYFLGQDDWAMRQAFASIGSSHNDSLTAIEIRNLVFQHAPACLADKTPMMAVDERAGKVHPERAGALWSAMPLAADSAAKEST